MRILVTGATGFVGSFICDGLHAQNFDFRRVSRIKPETDDDFLVSDISKFTDWSGAFQRISVVIHAAARVHVMNDESVDSLTEYRNVNVDGTMNLARQAADSGVSRFIYISSIKVNGEKSTEPFKYNDKHSPKDFYSISKSEAELSLIALSKETLMDIVIIRPPLIYGAGVKANFASLLNVVKNGFPLPFSLVNSNKRSMVSVYNLVDLIVNCVYNPNAANQVFLVSDDCDLSTVDLIKKMAFALGKAPRLFPVPVLLFRLLGKITGKAAMVERIVGSLQVDIVHTKETLGWKPPFSVSESMNLTVKNHDNS